MTEVTIRNKKLLSRLDEFVVDFFNIKEYNDPSHMTVSSEEAKTRPEYFCGREYLENQLALGAQHSGFPEEYLSHPVSNMMRQYPEKFESFKNKVKHEFSAEIGAHTSALLNYYPKGGFVGWHTNWNANAYQVLFTWSRTGDGYFKYLDKATEKIVTVEDKVGWQCRHYYFGKYDEPDHHCWHAAYAGCDRITLAYKFVNKGINDPQNRMALEMRDQLIEEIEME